MPEDQLGYSRSDGVKEMASGWFNMGNIMRLGLVSIMLICLISGAVSAAVSLSGPATVTRGGVSAGEPTVDGFFNLSVNGNNSLSAPMHLGVVINPQTMTGDICDRPPFLDNSTNQNLILGDSVYVWPWDAANKFKFGNVSPNGFDAPSVGAWTVPWSGTHYYGLINTNNTTVKVGTLYPDTAGSNEFLSTSVKPGTYTYHLQSDNLPSIPGVDSTDFNVTVEFGQLTAVAYDFTAWSKGSLVPVTTIQAGHTVMLQGINTDSKTTHLFVAGTGLPKCGQEIVSLTGQANPPVTGGAYLNGTWFYQWTAPCAAGEYTVYASSVDPEDVISRYRYSDGGGCSAMCSEGNVCGLYDCPTCSPEPGKVTITVVVPDFNFTVPEIVERCCCAAYPCGSVDMLTNVNVTGHTGSPGLPIQVWLFGNEYLGEQPYLLGTYTSLLDDKGSFALDLRDLLSDEGVNFCEIPAGDYNLIIQIPGCGARTFDVGPAFIPSDLVGYKAYQALIKKLNDTNQSLCLSCPPVKDKYVNLKFSLRDNCKGGSVDFTATPTEGLVKLPVQFTDVSTFTGTNWTWNFGDNATSTEQNPAHVYTTAGKFTVTLQVTNGSETKEQKKYDYITVNEVPSKYFEPVANFTFVPKNVDPMTIQFIDQSVGATELTYLWDFGDGTTSVDKVPAHTYSAANTYPVILTVTDTYGKTSSTGPQLIEVPAKPSSLPTIDFTADVLEDQYPLTVQFLDNTTTTWADSWQWNFGDGAVSSLRSPVHTYTTPGLYTVTLRAANVNGEGSEMTKENYINVQNHPPVITATADPMSGKFPLRVEFTAEATVNNKTVEQSKQLIQSWMWDFGDSSSSSEQNPVHVYEIPGNYPVTVTCQLFDGVSNMTDVGTIVVEPQPYANFYWEYLDKDETCCYLVKFTDTSVGAQMWTWDFGDGLTSAEQNPTHRFKEVGSYNVTLTVDDGSGKTDVMTKQVQITSGYTTPTPTPTPTPVPGEVTAKFISEAQGTRTIQFTDKSEGLIEGSSTWVWAFGDGALSNDQNPVHLYPKDGEYTVTLKASNGQFSDTESKTIGVR